MESRELKTGESVRRVGLFGGSFNPFHRGHLNLALKALTALELDILYVIPAKVSPFKTDCPPDKALAGFDDAERWRRVVAACAVDSRLIPWDIELTRGGVSYAIDTVRAAHLRHPEAELFFVIGEDSRAGLPRWKDWEILRTLCRFAVFPRTEESSTEIRRRLASGESADEWLI